MRAKHLLWATFMMGCAISQSPSASVDCTAVCGGRGLEMAGTMIDPSGRESCLCLKPAVISGISFLNNLGSFSEQLLDRSHPPPPSATPPSVAARAPEPEGARVEGIVAGIRKISDTEYIVERAFLDAVLSDSTDLARGARVVPSFKGGRPEGFKLFSIRPNSLYAALGLLNGDTVLTLGGVALASPDQALAAYQAIRGAKEIRADILRGEQPITFKYTIH